MKFRIAGFWVTLLAMLIFGCNTSENAKPEKSASEILGNPNYPAIAFGGYRHRDRSKAPTVDELKEDALILHAMGIRILRTYYTRLYGHTPRLLQAIRELKEDNPEFEMYVMLGAWIQCQGARTDSVNHAIGDTTENTAEIKQSIKLANTYPDIVKIIAVGNESMVHWAASYHVAPKVVLRWVNHLQNLKKKGELPQDLWITSSDNFASWGGGGQEYHNEDLMALVKSVDYISMHTYPFHDTHYNPEFWLVPEEEESLPRMEKIKHGMERAINRTKTQYQAVVDYVHRLDPQKAIHIGESGWATLDNSLYGDDGSHAADEHKQKLYYDAMGQWTDSANVSCFFFEAFDEPWKDGNNPQGSENHFGLFTVDGKAKYAIWDLVDNGTFEGLSRGGNEIVKTYGGNEKQLLKNTLPPPPKKLDKNE